MPNPTLEPVASPAAADATIGLKPGATEVVGLRTESSQTYDNHDGTMTSVFASSAKFYQPEGSSAWLPISVGFAAGSKTDGLVGAVPVVSSDRAPATVSLFNLTARDFVTVGTKGKSVGFALPLDLAKAAKPTAPIVDGVAADYRDVFPGADLRVIARASGSKAFVILHGVPADPRWTFRVDAPGLTLVPQANGSISLVDESGKAIGQIPHPYALDSTVDELAGDGRYTDQASVTLGQDTDGAPTITIAVDPAWLATAVYPVYVDPSVDIFHSTMVTADAHTSSSFPTTNYGTYQRPTSPYYYEMWLGLDPSGTSGTSHDYVRWDVSDLGTVTVESAQVSTHPWHQYYNAPTTIRSWIARLTSGFSESTITHNNRPSAGNDVAFIDGVEGQTSWSNPTSGFTGVVQGWVSTPATNYGVRIWQDGLGSTYWKRILASEDGTDVDYRPTLKVTWHVPTVTIVAPTGPTASKLLTWSYADSGSAPQTQYHVDVATADAFGGTIMSTSEDAGGSATSWTTPAALTEGATYYWRVRAFNGSSWSDWASSPFVWDATAPSVSAFTAPTTPTNATSLAYTTTFSEPVSGLAAGDFAISGTATGWSVTDVSGSGAGPYTITLTGGGAGTVILTLNANTVSDGASTGPASPSTAATVIVDQTVPSVSAFTAPASPTAETSLAYTTTFSEPVSGLAAGDFAISGTATGWSVTDVSGSGAGPYTITLTGGGAGTVILTLNANTVSDGASTGPASDVGATALSVGVDPTARWLLGTHTQLVVGNKNTPTAGDQAIRARLVAQGQSVTYVDDGDAPAVAGQNLIVIAASASAASLGTGYRNVAVPVLDLANASWDEMDYATATTHEPSGTALDVIDSSNSIAAGYSGSKTISTGGTLAYKLTSELAASAQKVWSITAQSSQVALFAYESGATMQNGHAAEARRVGLGWNDNVPTILNPTGWNVFDATARWLLGTHTQLVVGNKNTPTAGDQAIRARLVAQGQSVTYVDDGDAPAVAGQNLIVIAASASAASLGTGYRNVAVPVLDLANASWDEMDYATATTHEPSGTALDVIDSSNSIAAGYSGSKTISTGGTLAYKLTSELAASAQKVWSITAQSSQVALFAYESGATMQNGHAAEARRVGLGWNDNVPTILNPTGWNVFDATARWLLGREARPGIWVEMAPIITVLRGTSTAQSLTLMAVQEATGASVEVDPAISNVVTLGVLGSPFHVEAGGTYDVPLIVDVPTSTALGTTSGQVKIVAADGQVVASITVTLDTVDPQSGIVPQGVASPSGDRIGTDAVGDTLVVDGLVVGLDFGTLDPDGRILQIAAAHGAKVLGGVPSGFMYDLQVPVANLAELQSARDAIASEANVTFVSRTYSSADLQAIPNDPRYAAWDQSNPSGNNWDLELIRAPLAWDTTTGDRAVRVAIVDADMAWDHPDVADNVDLHAGPRVPSPTQIGHGTHVAGTACASGNNGVGVTGVAWRCSLTEWEFGIWVMPGGAEPPKEEHFPNRAAWLMLMAADQGAQVVNMSFGWPYGECAEKPNDAEAQAKLDETNHIFAQSILAAQAHFKDVLWVAAAGNSYGCNSAWNSPAGLSAQFPNNFITVASVNQAGQLSAFSDIGNPITVAAPGGEDPKVQPVDAGIYNTLPFHCKILGFLDCNEGYGFLAGTSMAAPHVTGLAVLVWSAHPGMSAAQVRTCIVDGAASMGIAVQGQVFHVIDAPAAVTCNPGG